MKIIREIQKHIFNGSEERGYTDRPSSPEPTDAGSLEPSSSEPLTASGSDSTDEGGRPLAVSAGSPARPAAVSLRPSYARLMRGLDDDLEARYSVAAKDNVSVSFCVEMARAEIEALRRHLNGFRVGAVQPLLDGLDRIEGHLRKI